MLDRPGTVGATQQRGVKPFAGVLHGRERELAAAVGVAHTACTNDGGVLLITGDAGIGKTAVLTEVFRRTAEADIRSARSKCDEIEQAWPGAPVLGLLRYGRTPLLSAAQYDEVARLATEPLLLVDRIAVHLDRIAANYPVVLGVDDVQWADRVTRYALRTLITRTAGLPIAWVLVSRRDDIGLTISAADVVDVEHLELRPLARRHISAIARDRLGYVPSATLDAMLDAAGGNALFATQLIDAARRDGASPEALARTKMAAIVAHWMARVTVDARRLIEAVAIAGRPMSVSDAIELSELQPGLEFGRALSSATGSGLLTATDAELGFGHDVIRETVYASMPPGTRRRLHSSFARIISNRATDPMVGVAHARLGITHGDDATADVIMTAAEALVSTSANDAADLALEAFSALRLGQRRWLEVGKRAVALLSHTQRVTDAITVADLLLATLDDPDEVGWIETHVVRAMWMSGRLADLVDRSDRMLALATDKPHLMARFQAARVLARTRMLPADIAAIESAAALRVARAVGDRDALAFALSAAGEAANSQRDHRLALTHFRELQSVTGHAHLAQEVMELQLLDRYDQAQALLDAARAESSANMRSLPPDLVFAQLKQDYNVGRLADTDAGGATLIDLAAVTGTGLHVLEGVLARAAVALLRGELVRAERFIESALELTHSGDATGHPGLALMHGWLAMERADVDRSVHFLAPLLAGDRYARAYWAWWPCWLNVLFGVGMAAADRDFARMTIEIAEEGAEQNPSVATLKGLALNLRGMFSSDLAMTSESVRILHRSPRAIIRATGSESYGRLLLAAGERGAALAQLDTAWDEYHQMGAWGRRAHVQQVMRDAGVRRQRWVTARREGESGRTLTEAEHRVALLIADGHTNKSAAQELGVSAYTVGSQLRSIYLKLGVQSRVQLANALLGRDERP
jgi:DNA-binding CsgD family transcriptional regulator